MKNTEEIAHRLKYFRKDVLKATQKEIFSKLNISQGNYSEIERGNRTVTVEQAMRLSTHFNVSIDWLLTGKGEMFLKEGGVSLDTPSMENGSVVKMTTEDSEVREGHMASPSDEPPPEMLKMLLDSPEAIKELKEMAKEANNIHQSENVKPMPIKNNEMDKRVEEEIPCILEEIFKVMLAVEITCQKREIVLNPHSKVTATAMIYDRWLKDKSIDLSEEKISPILKLLS